MKTTLRAAVCGLVLTAACAMAQPTADFLDITRVQVRGDKAKDFEDAIKKMAEVNRKYKGDRWIALSAEYGAEFGEFQFASSRPNLAAVETGMTAFQKALSEGMGPLADKFMRDLMATTVAGHSEIRHRRWDLSVNKPASEADWNKSIAQTRWIRALTLNMKPGRNMEYTEAWKPFGEELAKVTPAVPILVSESTTGHPAIFIGVYYKSWAEMDAGADSIQRAVSSMAYQHLTRVTQDAVAQSNWEILRIRPELSCAPDEVNQADPAFWTPKPAPAPKPKTAAPEKK